MRQNTGRISALAVVLAALAQAHSARASSTVRAGWNLLETDPSSTSFFGETFEGVPLGTFDFGGSIGVQVVGPTDTIIRRLEAATVPGPGHSVVVSTVVDAFQLRSVAPVSLLGGPLGIYYVTLASERGGPASTGTMTIAFGPEGSPHGTFSSSFELLVDVRLGGLQGPILDSRLISIPDSGSVPWRHEPAGPIQIPGVNLNLGGDDFEGDFWIVGGVTKQTPNRSIGARNAGASVPDLGGSFLLMALAFAGVGWAKMLSSSRAISEPAD